MLRAPFKSRFASFYGYEYFVALKQLTSKSSADAEHNL